MKYVLELENGDKQEVEVRDEVQAAAFEKAGFKLVEDKPKAKKEEK